jgi:hypothetical protein
MSFADYEILVDWDNDGDFLDAIENITNSMESAQFFRGRDYASQLTGKARAGRLELILNNSDKRFNAFLDSGPLYGNLLAGRPIKITMDVGGQKTTLWYGFLDSLDIDRNGWWARIRGVGPLGKIARREVNVPMQTSIATGAAAGVVLDEIGWPAGDRTIDAGQTIMTRWWTGGEITVISALRGIENTEFAYVGESKDGKLIFEDRHHRLKDPHLTSQATFTDDTDLTLRYQKIKQQGPLKQVFNIIEVDVRLYSVGALAVLWELDSNEVPAIGPGDTLDFWANFPNPRSDPEAHAVDAWTTPAATTDYEANSASDGSGTDLTSLIGVAVSKFDTSMKISLTNNASQTAHITKLQARGTPVNASDPITIKAEDSSSQTAHGERVYPSPAKFVPTTNQAQDYCDFLVSIYKDQIPVLRTDFIANTDDNHLNQARLRDISDRITVQNDWLGIDEDFFIEAITHRISHAGLEHWVRMDVSPASFWSGYWILGTSQLGIDTKLAY